MSDYGWLPYFLFFLMGFAAGALWMQGQKRATPPEPPKPDAAATVLTPGHGLPDVEPLDEYDQARHEAHLRGEVEQVLRGIPDWHS